METRTEEQIEQIGEHKLVVQELAQVCETLDKKFGRNAPIAQKMRTIYETMGSFTDQEIIDMTEVDEEENSETNDSQSTQTQNIA